MKTRTTLAAAFAAVAAIGAAAISPAAAPARNATAYPNSIAVLGHEGATGFGTNPGQPFQHVRSSSWATGTNTAVNSVYARILARSPSIRNRNFNFAEDGATVKDLEGQVRKALALKTKPELVLVQIMDHDIECDGQDATRYQAFGTELTAALQRLSAGLPRARIFVISRWGTLASYVAAVDSLGLGARLMHAGKGPCSIWAPGTGRLVPEHLAYVKRTLDGFHRQLAAACARVATCRYDGGAARRIRLTADDLSRARLQHLSISGQAKLAAAVWSALY